MRPLTWLLLPSTVIAVLTFHYEGRISAQTNGSFAATTIAKGRFGEIDVAPPNLKSQKHESSDWHSWQKTKGSSDLYVQSNVWTPGASTGWHTHPGHSLIIVTAGTVTEYEGDDPNCKPTVHTEGMGFVDRGGEHVHIIRNEGAVEARTIAVQLIPADAMHRIDAADPRNCQF
ncbi:MAG TPA: hypothetical protein VJ453_05250 [Terriglobales bacterium]|jgi:hypothetical protein|nr:hypothetical protein [Terriglobales bacterium]